MPLLEVNALAAGYGVVPVLRGLNLAANEGETAAVLGPNGAGKTTTLRCIAGLLRPWDGEVLLDGVSVTGWDAQNLVRHGVVLVPEGRRLFPGLSVEQNLRLGAWPLRNDRALFAHNRDLVFELFPRLAEWRTELSARLTGWDQQMLALGRGLMASPRLLLVDEPSAGLSPPQVQELLRATRRINAEGVTILMVEQHAGALRHADRGFLMEKGVITSEGPGFDLLQRPELIAALGVPG